MINILPISPSMDEKIVKFMHYIYDNMEIKDWFMMDSDEEIRNIINRGRKYSCIAMEDDVIAAICIINFYDNDDPEHYGYDAGLSREDLEKTAVMDITMVNPEYRGRGLQRQTVDYCEKLLKDGGYVNILATVHPENRFSLNNALKLGYEIKARKTLYYGLNRYVMVKKI